jgi:hypothetical protein
MKDKYILKRINDGRQWVAERVKYVEWDEEDGGFGDMYDEPKERRSCILNPQYGMGFTWITTQITKLEQRDIELHFNTRNSSYILIKLEN